jgi:8-oxo-dGTP diphosphatase
VTQAKIATAGGILFRDGKILIGKRQAHLRLSPNVWDIIGGHPEGKEKPEETLVRELKEELGITATAFRLMAILDKPASDIHIFLVTDWHGTPTNLPEGNHSELGWFSIDQALTLDLAHADYPGLLRSLGDSLGKK